MISTNVQRLIDLIPERGPRTQTGSLFEASAPCRHPERISHLAGLLHWLSPLMPISLEDQRILGLVGANGRPISGRDEEEPLEETEPAEEDAEGSEFEPGNAATPRSDAPVEPAESEAEAL